MILSIYLSSRLVTVRLKDVAHHNKANYDKIELYTFAPGIQAESQTTRTLGYGYFANLVIRVKTIPAFWVRSTDEDLTLIDA